MIARERGKMEKNCQRHAPEKPNSLSKKKNIYIYIAIKGVREFEFEMVT